MLLEPLLVRSLEVEEAMLGGSGSWSWMRVLGDEFCAVAWACKRNKDGWMLAEALISWSIYLLIDCPGMYSICEMLLD